MLHVLVDVVPDDSVKPRVRDGSRARCDNSAASSPLGRHFGGAITDVRPTFEKSAEW